MARQVVILDDLDGSTDAEEVIFAWDGVTWSVDLSAGNKAKLQELLQPYLDVAHPAEIAHVREPEAPRQRAARGTGQGKHQILEEEYGEPRRGRASREEAEFVRNNLDLVNERLAAKGMRTIDPADQKMKDRFGL